MLHTACGKGAVYQEPVCPYNEVPAIKKASKIEGTYTKSEIFGILVLVPLLYGPPHVFTPGICKTKIQDKI